MAVSKLILNVEPMGLLQTGKNRETFEFQVMLCSVEMWLILAEIYRAFGIRFSWCALFLAYQIWSQATATKIWKKWDSEAGIPITCGWRITCNQSTVEEIHKAWISRGQKEFLQITRAIGQEKNRWTRESVEEEHREQRSIKEWGKDYQRDTLLCGDNVSYHFLEEKKKTKSVVEF
jgi:hypothetical protein